MFSRAAGLLAAVLAGAGLNLILPPHVARQPLALHLETDSAVETVGLLSLGMRRLAADLELIRMLIYYGTPEPEEEMRGHSHEGGGHYPELGTRALRILDLDPAFSYAALYAAGALAFNMNRPAEALQVLSHALRGDPQNRQFPLYIGAIGFQRKGGNEDMVIKLLEPALDSPDCPTMIKSMMAFLYKKTGKTDKAARLYREIMENSRDFGYRGTAERMLAEITAERSNNHR